jgi:hypothetical protein
MAVTHDTWTSFCPTRSGNNGRNWEGCRSEWGGCRGRSIRQRGKVSRRMAELLTKVKMRREMGRRKRMQSGMWYAG